MQICGFSESLGQDVEWFKGMLFAHEYSAVYASKIFQFSTMPALPANAFIGGTGIDFTNTLPAAMANAEPSYTLYPDCDYHIGFSMKGCRFACKFCCVPQKEGRPRFNSTIPNILTNPRGQDRLMLLDNDFFADPEKRGDWRTNLETIIELDLKVCFVQGLNIRILIDEQAEMLAHCRFTNSHFNQKYLTFAWDDQYRDGKKIFEGIERCLRYGIKPREMQFFVLIGFDTTPEQDMERVMRLADAGCLPYVMPFNKFDPYQKAFTRWVNFRSIFKSVKWTDYISTGKRKSFRSRTAELLFD